MYTASQRVDCLACPVGKTDRKLLMNAVCVPKLSQCTLAKHGEHDDLTHAGIQVMREGRIEPLLQVPPARSSAAALCRGHAMEVYSIPACVIPRHEHLENFLHVASRGTVKYEVLTRGRTLRFDAQPGTTFLLPRGTIDELIWKGPTHRAAVALHPRLLVNALEETAHESEIELTQHWNLTDPHIMAVLLAMAADLDAGSPAGRIYGESLANALAVYLVNRYAVRPRSPAHYRRGLPRHRLRRVLDHIGDNLASDLSLGQLASVAGMSPHYFIELFRQSTGQTPHQYVLLRRIEQAKESLRNCRHSVIRAGLDAGFQNRSHFSRVFRKFVGTTPSNYQSEVRPDL